MRFTLLFLFFNVLAYAQDGIPTGVVVQNIQLDAAASETYSLYLPRDYDTSREYPVVFIFNDQSNTASIVQQFTIAAELNGAVIVGANYKLSDTLSTGLKQSQKLINTVFNQYSLDKNRIILAGIGNGALIASSSAHVIPTIYGVIAVNSVFLEKKKLPKENPAKFVILSSEEGKNYYRLKSYDSAYGLKKIVAGYYEYDGDGWPPQGYLAAALSDILLTETTPVEEVQALYESDLNFSERLLKNNLQLQAFDFVNDLKDKYRKRINIDAQKELLKNIRNDRTYKIKRLRQNTIRYAEQVLVADFNYYITEDSRNSFFDNLGWWSYQMDDIDAKIDSSATNRQERKAALRLKGFVVSSVEEKYDILRLNNGSTEQLLFINVLRTLVDPMNFDAYIQAISLSAREGDSNAALFYLEELLQTGYDDYERLYTIEYTISLRTGLEFNELVRAYLGKSKYY